MKPCFVDGAADAVHTEMVLHVVASENIVEGRGNTSVAEVEMAADHTLLGHVDHALKAKQLRRGSWFAECGKKWEGTALQPFETQPLYLEFLAAR